MDAHGLNSFMNKCGRFSLSHSQTNWQESRGLFSSGGGAAEEQRTLEDIAKKVRERRCKRVLVMAGAGISTPSGIPDFR